MKLHLSIMASAGFLLLGACSSSYKTTFPEPAYVKIPANHGSLLEYPNTPESQQELAEWYESVSLPVSLPAAKPARHAARDRKPVVLAVKDVSANLYRDRTEVSRVDRDGHWQTTVRPVTPADQQMKNHILATVKKTG